MTDEALLNPPLAPRLVCDGAAEAIDFYVRAFGAGELEDAMATAEPMAAQQ
jgi:uncharacterized glyoxalase superfamily protein PhnB